MGPVQAHSQTAREAGRSGDLARRATSPPFKDSADGGANPKRPAAGSKRDERQLRTNETTMHMRSVVGISDLQDGESVKSQEKMICHLRL